MALDNKRKALISPAMFISILNLAYVQPKGYTICAVSEGFKPLCAKAIEIILSKA